MGEDPEGILCPACGHRPDPFPVGSKVTVRDYDGTILGPFTVVRSYWPVACCELSDDDDPDHWMIRQNHDRIIPSPERTTT